MSGLADSEIARQGSLTGALRRRRSGEARGRFGSGLRSPSLLIGLALIGLILAAASLAPWLTDHPPNIMDASRRLAPPSAEHPFGTDRYGRDLLSRVLYGARLDLRMAAVAAALSVGIALPLAALAGFYGGWVDRGVSALLEIWLVLPGLLLAIVIVAVFGPSIQNAMIAIGLMSVPTLFRTIRGSILSARQEQYVEAARAVGTPDWRIVARHVLPNVASTVIIMVTLRLSLNLLVAGGLSFIGLGVQPPDPEWGALLAEGKAYMQSAWWLATFPGLAMCAAVVGFNLLGDGLRDVLDPRQHSGRDAFVR